MGNHPYEQVLKLILLLIAYVFYFAIKKFKKSYKERKARIAN
jgi:hypothetical protein